MVWPAAWIAEVEQQQPPAWQQRVLYITTSWLWITIRSADECEGLFQDPYSSEICLNRYIQTSHLLFKSQLAHCRYGSCVPFSEYMLGSGIPCDRVYESGTDYVYIIESIQTLNVIWEIEEELQEDSYCIDSLLRMICHYYLPPCGNSTDFEPPTSVCSDACYLLSKMCPTHWGYFESELRKENIPLNCSYVEYVYSLYDSCSDLGVRTSKFYTQK